MSGCGLPKPFLSIAKVSPALSVAVVGVDVVHSSFHDQTPGWAVAMCDLRCTTPQRRQQACGSGMKWHRGVGPTRAIIVLS